jgi:hypothetical protein
MCYETEAVAEYQAQQVDNKPLTACQQAPQHPVDKLLEQHCCKSAAGLLQLVRLKLKSKSKPL